MTDPTNAPLFALPVNLDMQAARPLQAELLSRRGTDVTLGGAQVEKLGGQCLQILLAAQKTWKAGGHDFKIDAMSDSFITALAGFGVAPANLNTGNEVAK